MSNFVEIVERIAFINVLYPRIEAEFKGELADVWKDGLTTKTLQDILRRMEISRDNFKNMAEER